MRSQCNGKLVIDTQNNLLSLALSRRVVLFLLVAVFAAEFLVRGPVRFLQQGSAINDFMPPFVQAKALARGVDPYSPQELLRLWPKDSAQLTFLVKDAAAGTMQAKDGVPSPYPLSCLAVLALFSGIPWHIARIVLLVSNVLGSLLLIGVLLSLSGLGLSDRRTYAFLGLALGIAPLHAALATGNLIIPACTCGVVAIWCAIRDHNTLSGAFLAVAICLKPPVGIIFVVLAVIRRRWHVTLVAVVLSALVTAAAILRLWTSHVDWIQAYSVNLNKMFASGAINDFTKANPLRFHLLNLQVPISSFATSPAVANEIAWSISAVLLLVWLGFALQSDTTPELLDLSAITAIALLPVYHRFVDGMLLIVPLSWCFSVQRNELKPVSRIVMVLLLPFLVPGASLLTILSSDGVVPVGMATTWWWNAFVVPHEIWAVLLISFALLYAMGLSRHWIAKPESAFHRTSQACAGLAQLPQT